MIPILPPTGEPAEYNDNYILYWNNLALDLNRLSHSLPTNPQGGPAASSRVLGILHLAIHDAYFAINPPADQSFTCYLAELPPHGGLMDARTAVAGAAITALEMLYTTPSAGIATATTFAMRQTIGQAIDGFSNLDARLPEYRFGAAVARALIALLIPPNDPGVGQGAYRTKEGPYKFRVEPNHPVRLVPVDPNNPNGPKQAIAESYGPFYGGVRRFAVQTDDHVIADPPAGAAREDPVEDIDSLLDTIRSGVVPEDNRSRRSPSQNVTAYFWAYDGTNLIGTPPRLYNQILRKLAFERRPDTSDLAAEANNADFARLLALCNAAMGDAGIFSWREKYTFEIWRPLTGVREHPSGLGDPFFQTVGSPETNNNGISFKPPFPAYPSGHATFGGATFQMARLYYKRRDGLDFADDAPDDIGLEFVSDELNGVNRDLREDYDPARPITQQVGTVRTRVPVCFSSLWEIMHENALSRVFLGVHWRFDAFAARDVLVANPNPEPGASPYALNPDGSTRYKPVAEVRYETRASRFDRDGLFPIGGVPLGIGIANEIFSANLQPTPENAQPGQTTQGLAAGSGKGQGAQRKLNGANGTNGTNGTNGGVAA
ncbi:hypothetical protein RB597_009907 [Gaeumannomyces tritici]